MSSKAITTEQDRPGERPDIESLPEVAPSRLREDDQSLPRTIGLIGAVFVVFGAMALGFHLYGRAVRVTPGWSLFFVLVGLCGLLYHASFDRDVLFRRLYLMFSLAALAVGVVLCLIPYPKLMGDQLRFGAPCLILSLLFCQAGLRNEADLGFRNLIELIFGGAGGLMALVGLFGGSIREDFLLPVGVVFSVLGLLYLAAFIANRGVGDDLAYYAALGMAAGGLIITLIPLVRALAVTGGTAYFTGYGVILVGLGLAYTFTGGGLASDTSLLVLFRRELGAMFLSPITYLVLIGFSGVWMISWWGFVDELVSERGNFEPIVRNYLFSLFPVIMIIIAAPVLTMGMFSEESRSGTLEVLLTAPVSEAVVVLSKFLAAMVTYLLVWLPAGLYLLAIPLSGGPAFDYQPLLSFGVAMTVSGAAFVSMGIFFSSLTRNMLVAAVLSITMMLLLTFLYFPAHMLPSTSGWSTPLQHMSYLDLYFNSLEGKLTPKYLLFPASLTLLFLFLTLKVLESRKWR